MFDDLKYYFTVGDKKYYSDMDALRNSNGAEVNFQLNYNFIKNGNWKKRPTESIYDLFDTHTKIIYEKYEQIILMYSGGTDSHTILESFIRCGIRDVIIYESSFVEQKQVKERWNITQDMLKSLSRYKQTFKDLNYKVLSAGAGEDFSVQDVPNRGITKVIDETMPQKLIDISHHGSYHRLTNNANDKLRINTKRKTAVVWGFSKPSLRIFNNQWHWYTTSSDFLIGKVLTTEDYDDVYFFITDEVPNLHIKLTWLKIEVIESILKTSYRNDMSMSDRVVMLQINQSPFYENINESMGYRALNKFLNGSSYKPGGKAMKLIRPKLLANIPTEVKILGRELTHGIKNEDLTTVSKPIPIKAFDNA